MSEKALALTGMDTATISIAADFIQNRDRVLEAAGAITVVTDLASQADAVFQLSRLKAIRLSVSNTKDAVKRPVIDLGRKIEEVAKEALGKVSDEEKRLLKAVEEYQAELRRQAAEEERKRREEERQKQEAAAAEQREIERKRLEAEQAARRAEELKTKQARSKAAEKAQAAQDEADRLQLEKDAREYEEQQRGQETTVAVAPVQGGMKSDEVDDFEVLDVVALVKAFPGLCNIEPKRKLILEAIANGQTEIPGLRIFKTTKVKITR